jgi:ethanolamine-phosphate phospho-lyase
VALIGDVRGSGLFIGIELVTDAVAKTPATSQAQQVMARLLQKHHVLTSLDGRYDNVFVVKPPMCFSMENADTFVQALEECLLGCK